MRRHHLPALLAFLAFALPLTAQQKEPVPERAIKVPKVEAPPQAAATGFETINPADCTKWLTYLSGDECEGRKTGTTGHRKAAEYVAAHFKEIGLKPIGDKDANGAPTYFQNVPFVRAGIDATLCKLEIKGAGLALAPKFGEGWGCSAGSGDINGAVVFAAGEGKMTAEKGSMAGQIVIVIPGGESTDPATAAMAASAIRKNTGALAILQVDDVKAAAGGGDGARVVRKDTVGPSGPRTVVSTPTAYITRAMAESIATAAKVDLKKVAHDATGQKTVKTAAATGVTAHLVLVDRTVDVPVPNVVGFLEGSDPVLKHECVIIGSHLDHLGRGADGVIFHGADDDGSGSTGLLAVSRAFAKNGHAPKRSMMFIAVCGEEMGLLGSDWYVEHPIIPLKDCVAELQMDMIGRREENHPEENPTGETADENINTLHLIGSKKLSTELHKIILAINEKNVGFEFEYDQEGVYTRSDHYNFAKKGIPISFFFTGFHMDYHKVTDTIEKIDFPKLARVAQLVYLTGYEVADRQARIVVDGKVPGAGRSTPKQPKD